MKALVIGSSGQIGGILAAQCAARGLETAGAGVGGEKLHLDLAAPAALKDVFAAARPGVVFLCSAMTYVDGCERDPELARRVNAAGPALVAEECRAAGARLVYLSTEYVFDGKAGPYGEEDPVNPVSVYGRTKLEGEQAVLAIADALVIRTTVVYSYSATSVNFIMQLIANARAGKAMSVPKDQFSNPTYAPALGTAILDLALKGAGGIYNVVGPDLMDRYAFALKACAAFGFSPAFLVPRLTAELGQSAPRPLNAGLKTEKLVKALGHGLPPAEQSLAEIAALLKKS
ncbi:MAG TPA: SDR family oxidoreductase [Elusimicrobiales bacterium]|nr:SDR family oxidoreductase [Elusimicrobiales bacterium]